MLGWWKRRKAYRAQIEADAQDLIERYGDLAYDEAWSREARQNTLNEETDLPERPTGHWERVRYEIARKTGRDRRVDTATRYLED